MRCGRSSGIPSGAAVGDILVWDGTDWVPSSIAAAGLPFTQAWGAQSLANLPLGALLPGPSDSPGVNQVVSDSTAVTFPSVGGTLRRMSLFLTQGAVGYAVDVNFFVAVNQLASVMLGTLVAGQLVLEVTTPLVLPALATGYELRLWYATAGAALPGATINRPKAVVSGYVNP